MATNLDSKDVPSPMAYVTIEIETATAGDSEDVRDDSKDYGDVSDGSKDSGDVSNGGKDSGDVSDGSNSMKNEVISINKRFVRLKDGGEFQPGTTYLMSGPNGLKKKMIFNGENFVEPPGSSSSNGENFVEPPGSSSSDGENFVEPPGSSSSDGENFIEPPGSSSSDGENFVEPPGSSSSNQENTDKKYSINKKFVKHKNGGEFVPGMKYLVSGPDGVKKKMVFDGENFVESRGETLLQNKENPPQSFPCPICGDSYKFKESFLEHIKSEHMKVQNKENPPKSFPCPICGDNYKFKESFLEHIESEHMKVENPPKKFQCPICGRSYKFQESFLEHIESDHKKEESDSLEVYTNKKMKGDVDQVYRAAEMASDESVRDDECKTLKDSDLVPNTTRLMNILPAELLVMIFSYLSQHEIISMVMNVCNRWKDLSTSPSLWRTVRFTDEFSFTNYPKGFLAEFLGKVGPSIETVVFDHEKSFATLIDEVNERVFDSLKEFDMSSFETRKLLQEGSFEMRFGDLRFPKLQHISVFAMVQHIEQIKYAFDDEKFYKMSLNIRKPLYYMSQLYPDDVFDFNKNMIKIIKNQAELKEFSLQCFVLEDRTVDVLLTHCQSLNLLSLSKCTKLTDKSFENMSVSQNLVDINLDGTNISDKVVEKVCLQCPSLKSLSLYRCFKVTQNSIAFISSRCKSLERFIFSGFKRVGEKENNYSLQLLQNLNNLKLLRQKNVCTIPVNDMAIQGIICCLNLVDLEFNLCIYLTDNHLVMIAQTLKNLRTIQFGQCTQITSVGVQAIMMLCWMKTLKIDGCKSLVDLNFPELTANIHSHILELSLAKTKMNDAALENVAAMCPDLRKINLQMTKGISDVSVVVLMRKCKFLSDLDISEINTFEFQGITDNIVYLIAEHLPKVRCLNISGFPEQYLMTLDGWNNLIQRCSSLEKLIFSVDWERQRVGMNFDDIGDIRKKMKKDKKFKIKMNDVGLVCVSFK